MSLTSYRAAPPRVREGSCLGFCVGFVGLSGWKTWQRPTLPRLETEYHRRRGFSRPSSGWDRVRSPRYGHQVVEPDDPKGTRGWLVVLCEGECLRERLGFTSGDCRC